MRPVLSLAILAVPAALMLRGGEPVPEKPEKKDLVQPSAWRPYKDLQDVLYFEGFEHSANGFEHGKIVAASTEDPLPPGNHAWKMEKDKDNSFVFLHVHQTPLKMPQGLNPAQIHIQFSIYADEAGTVNLKFIHGSGDYGRDTPVPKVKTWSTVTMKLSDVRNKDAHPEADHVIKEFEIRVKGKGKGPVPKCWIDDVIFTYNINPTDVRARLAISEKKRSDMEKTSAKDGYEYSMPLNDFLKAALKSARASKNKHVLVMGPTPELTEVWTKQIAAAAPKVKETNLIFDPADDPAPGSKRIGGLPDMRTLLPYNLQKEPEMLLLVIGPEDALGPGRPADSIRVVIERALSAGIVSVVCIPAPEKKEDVEKMTVFAKSVEGVCAQFGAAMVDGAFYSRNAKGEYDIAKPPVLEKTVLLTATAIKHVRDSLASKD